MCLFVIHLHRNHKTESPVAQKGKALSYLKQRDFVNKVDEVHKMFIKQGLNYRLKDICSVVAASHAPRFYIEEEEALEKYHSYLRGESAIRKENTRRMYAEIFSRYEHYMKIAHASGQIFKKYETMRRVLEQEAPSFYYDSNTALKTYYCFKNKLRKEKK